MTPSLARKLQNGSLSAFDITEDPADVPSGVRRNSQGGGIRRRLRGETNQIYSITDGDELGNLSNIRHNLARC